MSKCVMVLRRRRSSVIWLTVALGAGMALALIWIGAGLPTARAGVLETVVPAPRFVATDGLDSANDCTDGAFPCATIQHAVDVAAEGDELRVAAGTYTGTKSITRTWGTIVYTYTQVAYVDKSLTLRGGYSAADWTEAPDPVANPTIIDAQHQGRGVTVVGTPGQVMTIDGFMITGGDYTGLGNPPGVANWVCARQGADCGGGLYVYRSQIHLLNSVLTDNIASQNIGFGGGIYIWDGYGGSIENTTVGHNTATGGGGLAIHRQWLLPIRIGNSNFLENTAGEMGGGGSYLYGANSLDGEASIILEQVTMRGNTSEGDAGGMYAQLTSNGMNLRVDQGVFQKNEAQHLGKAFYLDAAGGQSPEVSLTNILLTENAALSGLPPQDEDAVIAIYPRNPSDLVVSLTHVTAVDNPVESFLFAEANEHLPGGHFVAISLTNTLLSGFASGFVAREANVGEVTIQHSNSLLHNVAIPTLSLGGSPTFIAVNPVNGSPLLDANYRLQAGSAAIDAGINTGLSHDLDGQYRPQGAAADIGADEYYQLVAPQQLGISGPSTAVAQTAETYSVVLAPMEATQPITYVWQASGLDPITHTGGLSDTADLTWNIVGSKIITVVAINAAGRLEDTYPIDVIGQPRLTIRKYAPLEANAGAVITYTLVVTNDGTAPATSTLISDTLPTGLSLTGPVVLDPPGAGTVGAYPIVADGVTISTGQRITLTLPAMLDAGLLEGTVISNIAAVTSAEVPTPQVASAATTLIAVVTPAEVVSTVPVSGAVSVVWSTPVVITFSKPISIPTFSCVIVPDPGDWAGTWNDSQTVVTLSHAAFVGSAVHTFTITTADDLVGNPLSNAPVEWRFTTAKKHSIYLPLVVNGF